MHSASAADGRTPARVTQSARLAILLGLLEERPYWTVAELAQRFEVSEETIRRDVRQLEQSGQVQKTHGGVGVPSSALEAPYRNRLREQAEAKQRIAQRALQLIEPGMALLLDSGTTSFWLARALAHVRDLTIITNSIEIAHEVMGRPAQRLFVAGGRITPDYRAAFGPEAIDYAARFVPDLTVLSIGAVEADRGFVDFDVDEAMFKRALLKQSRRIVVLADATKFTRRGLVEVAPYQAVRDLVTDQPLPAPIAAAAEAAGMRVHLAG